MGSLDGGRIEANRTNYCQSRTAEAESGFTFRRKLLKEPAAFLALGARLKFRDGAVAADAFGEEIFVNAIGLAASADGITGIEELFDPQQNRREPAAFFSAAGFDLLFDFFHGGIEASKDLIQLSDELGRLRHAGIFNALDRFAN